MISHPIEQLRAVNDGQLPAYAWPGGYPMYYVDLDCSVLCPACANGDDAPPIISYDVNWEDGEMYCDDCGERIPSAYAED